jgi:hypothetical protein
LFDLELEHATKARDAATATASGAASRVFEMG